MIVTLARAFALLTGRSSEQAWHIVIIWTEAPLQQVEHSLTTLQSPCEFSIKILGRLAGHQDNAPEDCHSHL